MKMPIRVTSRPTALLPLLLLLLTTMLLLLVPSVAGDCPSLCECKWKNGKESVRCHNASLTEIPPRLDAGTQVLDLQRNEIVRLDGDEFSAVNLLNLQKIFLIDCQLTALHRFAFRNLINLVELDLSENRLAAVPSHVFDSMSELRELRLSGNPVLRLDNLAFNGLAHLVRLELSSCRIRRIELRAFEGVRQSLEWLKLDGNELINVQPAALTVLNNLHGIELTRNNWNCTCTLRPLREWMLRQNIPYEVTPVCSQPERLRGKPWSRMDVDEFACPPAVVAFASNGSSGSNGQGTATGPVTVKAIEGQNVTIGCGIVAGNPDPTIRWMFRNRIIVGNVSLRSTSSFPSSSSASAGGSSSAAAVHPEASNVGGGGRSSSSVAAITTLDTRKKFHHHLSRAATNVTIAWIDNPDSGVYKCIAENEAGRSEAIISVLVYSRHYLIDSNNNVVEASVALAHSNNRFIFIISTIVAVLFVVLSLLLAICYYTVHKKNRRAGGGHLNHQQQHASEGGGEQGPSNRKKKLDKRSFRSLLLCQKDRSESYEKIEMLTRTNPVTSMRTDRGGVDETSCKIYCEREEDEEDDTMGLAAAAARGQFPVSASPLRSIQDKRRSMSLNLSNSASPPPPTTMANQQSQQQRKREAAAAVKLSCRRRNGDYYSNVPTTAEVEEEELQQDSAGGHRAKLMAGERTTSKLFTKHQAQAAAPVDDRDGGGGGGGDEEGDNSETQRHPRDNNQWLSGRPSKSFLPPPGELGIASQSAVNVHQHQSTRKVTSNSSSSSAGGRSNINLSRSNFSHPLADLCPTSSASSTEPLINIGGGSGTTSSGGDGNLDLLLSTEEVIRHHVMRKRILTEGSDCCGEGNTGPESGLNNSKGIVIYTTAKGAEQRQGDPSPESLTATQTIIGEFDDGEDKLGRLSPTLNSIMRNDENFDLFDVKSNLDDFYVKQLNYDYHQLQQQQRQLLQSHQLLASRGGAGGDGSRKQENYFCSLPRKRTPYESKKNLMGFSPATMHEGCGEDLFDAPLEESLFRSPSSALGQRQKSSSELDLMASFETSSASSSHNNYNGLSFIMGSGCDGGGADNTADNGRTDGRQGAIIKPLSDNNRATPLLNFPTPAKGTATTGSGNGISSSSSLALNMGSGIFPSNCGSPSIMMSSSAGGCVTPLAAGASSILSPTNISGASSSSPSSSASSSALKKTNGSGKGAGDYDYHAAQLEMFLDEYKRLQQQLCKMKETCDSIRRTEELYGGSPGGGGGVTGKRNANKPATISSALSSGLGMESMLGVGVGGASHQYYPMNSKLLEKSNVLLPASQDPFKTLPKSFSMGNKHKSYSGPTPEPPPYWLHRNELLKGIQSQQQQQQVFSTASGLGTNHHQQQPQKQQQSMLLQRKMAGSGCSSSNNNHNPGMGESNSSSGGSS